MIAELLESIVGSFGYIGMFFVSFIGALSIFFPIPYTVLILIFANRMDPILLSISSGLGAGLGEVSGYLLGRVGRKALSQERRKRIEALRMLLSEYGLIVIFLFALTPFPDDLIFIPLGLMEYPLLPSLVACISGKILMSYLIASFGKFYANFLRLEENWLATVVSVVVLLALIAFMFKIDWEKFLDRLPRKSKSG